MLIFLSLWGFFGWSLSGWSRYSIAQVPPPFLSVTAENIWRQERERETTLLLSVSICFEWRAAKLKKFWRRFVRCLVAKGNARSPNAGIRPDGATKTFRKITYFFLITTGWESMPCLSVCQLSLLCAHYNEHLIKYLRASGIYCVDLLNMYGYQGRRRPRSYSATNLIGLPSHSACCWRFKSNRLRMTNLFFFNKRSCRIAQKEIEFCPGTGSLMLAQAWPNVAITQGMATLKKNNIGPTWGYPGWA